MDLEAMWYRDMYRMQWRTPFNTNIEISGSEREGDFCDQQSEMIVSGRIILHVVN
jgi:hypothetical protein